MKFGGSSLADASRVDHVCRLIKDQIKSGTFPSAVVCSAMGKTTNNLLNAGDFALQGRVSVDPLRTLHLATIEEFGLGEHVKEEVRKATPTALVTTVRRARTHAHRLGARRGHAAKPPSSPHSRGIRDKPMHPARLQHTQMHTHSPPCLLSARAGAQIESLLNELENMLSGVKLLQELSPRSLDMLVSFGERMSSRIVAARLNQLGVPANAFDSWSVGLITTSEFGDATVLPSSEGKIRATFKDKIDPGTVAVVTGFIGHDVEGKITTLGRGGR